MRYLIYFALCVAFGGCKKRPPRPAPPATVQQTDQQLQTGFVRVKRVAAQAMPIAEAIKCRRLRERLRKVGANPHGLGVFSCVELPLLRDDEALLLLFEHQGKIYRYLKVGRNEPRSYGELAKGAVDQLVIKTRDTLELEPLDQVRPLWELLFRLYRMVFADLEGALAKARTLIIAEDGMLRLVPFQLLVTKREPLLFLVQKMALVHTPCLALTSPTELRPGKITVVAPRYGRERERSVGVEAEVAALRQVFGKRLFVPRAATAIAFETALNSSPSGVHFSGHGLSSLPDPVSDLVFPRGARAVTMQSATRKKIKASLVFLGSCATAYAARFRDSKNLVAPTNLVEALLAAGAHSVVASSWTVKDQRSAAQVEAFYRALGAHGPAQALARAQRRALVRLKPPHPRIWGAYVLYGGWR